MKNIYLIGFMGAGKSSVGSKLSELTGAECIEMDRVIEERQGRKITEIFAQEGEEYFRDLETAQIYDFDSRNDLIVSCGGGIVVRPQNAEHMKKNGVIVYLTASPQTILDRVKNSDERPILNGHKNVGFISELMDKRSALYLSAADIIIETDGRTVLEIAQEIISKINL